MRGALETRADRFSASSGVQFESAAEPARPFHRRFDYPADGESQPSADRQAPPERWRSGLQTAQADVHDEAAIDEVWRKYRQTRSLTLRNILIIHYMSGHVRRIAQRLHAQLPRQVELEDLVVETYEALVDLIERFDIDRNVRFETFSSQRLYGQMRDHLRAIDPAPRTVRCRAKKVQAALESFHKLHGRSPSADELRHHMKLPEKIFKRFLADSRPAIMVSFNGAAASSEDADAMAGFEDHHFPTPLDRAEHSDLRRWITQGFNDRDRLILILYYYEQLTMKEIGHTLGCSESRVSQRLESILERLRSRLDRTGSEQELYGK